MTEAESMATAPSRSLQYVRAAVIYKRSPDGTCFSYLP